MKEKYDARFWVRLSTADKKKLDQMADRCGISSAGVIRNLIRKNRLPPPMSMEMKEAIFQLSRIGNNLNQLARAANTTGNVPAEREFKNDLEDLKAILRKISDLYDARGG